MTLRGDQKRKFDVLVDAKLFNPDVNNIIGEFIDPLTLSQQKNYRKLLNNISFLNDVERENIIKYFTTLNKKQRIDCYKLLQYIDSFKDPQLKKDIMQYINTNGEIAWNILYTLQQLQMMNNSAGYNNYDNNNFFDLIRYVQFPYQKQLLNILQKDLKIIKLQYKNTYDSSKYIKACQLGFKEITSVLDVIQKGSTAYCLQAQQYLNQEEESLYPLYILQKCGLFSNDADQTIDTFIRLMESTNKEQLLAILQSDKIRPFILYSDMGRPDQQHSQSVFRQLLALNKEQLDKIQSAINIDEPFFTYSLLERFVTANGNPIDLIKIVKIQMDFDRQYDDYDEPEDREESIQEEMNDYEQQKSCKRLLHSNFFKQTIEAFTTTLDNLDGIDKTKVEKFKQLSDIDQFTIVAGISKFNHNNKNPIIADLQDNPKVLDCQILNRLLDLDESAIADIRRGGIDVPELIIYQMSADIAAKEPALFGDAKMTAMQDLIDMGDLLYPSAYFNNMEYELLNNFFAEHLNFTEVNYIIEQFTDFMKSTQSIITDAAKQKFFTLSIFDQAAVIYLIKYKMQHDPVLVQSVRDISDICCLSKEQIMQQLKEIKEQFAVKNMRKNLDYLHTWFKDYVHLDGQTSMTFRDVYMLEDTVIQHETWGFVFGKKEQSVFRKLDPTSKAKLLFCILDTMNNFGSLEDKTGTQLSQYIKRIQSFFTLSKEQLTLQYNDIKTKLNIPTDYNIYDASLDEDFSDHGSSIHSSISATTSRPNSVDSIYSELGDLSPSCRADRSNSVLDSSLSSSLNSSSRRLSLHSSGSSRDRPPTVDSSTSKKSRFSRQ